MSKQVSEKRTSPWKNNPTSHYTPETHLTVGNHGGHGGTVADGGSRGGSGGRGGHGGHGGHGLGHGGPSDEQGHGKGGGKQGVGQQGGVHQGLEVVFDESFTSRELSPAPPRKTKIRY